MKKKMLITTCVAIFVASGLAVAYISFVRQSGDGNSRQAPGSGIDPTNVGPTDSEGQPAELAGKQLTGQQLREKFSCDRITDDLRATDIYCKDPSLYYQDVDKGTVIEPGDLEDPRYKAMFP